MTEMVLDPDKYWWRHWKTCLRIATGRNLPYIDSCFILSWQHCYFRSIFKRDPFQFLVGLIAYVAISKSITTVRLPNRNSSKHLINEWIWMRDIVVMTERFSRDVFTNQTSKRSISNIKNSLLVFIDVLFNIFQVKIFR